MKTKAVRLYGKNDLRLEEFELPEIKDDEILAHIISDSICMSSHKAALQGNEHKRVPKDIDKNPVIIGHEFCGEIVEVGSKWKNKFKKGNKFSIQPAINKKENPYAAPGYTYKYIGGNATFIIIPNEIMELNCLLNYKGDAFFYGSLAEPMSCIVGAFHASYHTENGKYIHKMGIVKDGNMAILGGLGPMGLGAIDYAIHCDIKPELLVVTDIDEARIKRAESISYKNEAKENGITLKYINTVKIDDPVKSLLSFTGNKGFDDVFIFAPVKEIIELGDKILSKDGCLNFFAGPTDTNFNAKLNFYNVHYNSAHIVGTSGGNTFDMIESLEMMEKGLINPSVMITHVGGLNSVIETTLNLPKIPGGKKLIYTNINLNLTAINDFKKLGEKDPFFSKLSEIVEENNGFWSLESEKFLLANGKPI